ncbi:MAG: hypothetical protein ACYC7A_16750 [Thermoanaerobaculia bacterium]
MDESRDRTGTWIATALLWTGAFAFVFGAYLILEKHLRVLPPTDPVGVGRVTVVGASKLEDYAGLALFYLFVPLGTYFGGSGLVKLHRRAAAALDAAEGDGRFIASAAVITAALLLSPWFALTTRKEGWAVLMPPLLAWGAIAAWRFARSRPWIAALRAPELRATHALLITEAAAALLFRYLVTGRRVAHIPTLLLEIVFVALLALAFWAAAVGLARLVHLRAGREAGPALTAVAVGAAPLLLLPIGGLFLIPTTLVLAFVLPIVLVTISASISRGVAISPRGLRNAVAYGVVPYLLFCATLASTVALSQWIDLFHRGETLGPASDYLRGKLPYRDVFVLHGLLENGLLDAWLMELFGRDLGVASARAAVMSSLTYPAVWILAMVIFDSLPLAAIVVGLGLVTFVDHQRVLLQIVALLFVATALRWRKPALAFGGGVAAAVALFFSLEIGLYSIAAGVATFVILPFVFRRSAGASGDVVPDAQKYRAHAVRPYGALALFIGGVAVGAAPFLIYLGTAGVLGLFFRDSFVTIPSIIDAVWSLPLPELTRPFRYDLTLRTFVEFFLGMNIRYVLNPFVIGLAMTYLIARIARRRFDSRDALMLAATIFALLAQRSAAGRADFQHQHFAAFLLAPLMVFLVIIALERLAPLWRSGNRGSQAFVALLVAVAAPVAFTALWVPDLLNARLDDVTLYRPRISTIGFLDPKAKAVEERIDAVKRAVAKYAKPGEPIFDFSNQPALYYFTNRPNPTRFYQVPILSPAALQMEAIAAIDRAKPPVVLRRSPDGFDRFDGIENELRAPALAAYLDDHYRYRATARGIDVYTRRPGVRRDPQSYRRFIAIPKSADTSPIERIVIPAIGSLEGASGSRWASELLLYNPHQNPLRLRLRYTADRDVAERTLTLPSRKIVRMDDAARAFFGLPNSRGSVTIEYRATAPPYVRSRTRDVAKGGRAPLERPLSAADAATAGTPADTLAILGANGTWPRRVNVGIAAAGHVPARIHISARTRNGEIVGLPVETIVAEGEPYLLVDANKPLGVPIDESISIHVRVVSGSAVAWASVVDGTTGDQEMIVGVPTIAP